MYQTNNLYVLTSTNWSTKVLTLNPQIYIFSSQKYTNVIDAESQVYQCTAMTHLVAHTNVPMHSNGTSHHATHKWTNALADQWLPHHACPVDTVAGSTRIQTLCCHRLWEPAGFIFEDFNNFIQLYFILCVLSLIIDGAPFSKILFLLGHHSMFMDRCCQTRSRHQTRIKTE